ncbi:MAG TPA: histidine kinase [Actinoplanes sp.]|nr:histidine kinase [Actinoplanes sp.]
METSGPAGRRNAMGPLRRLAVGPDRPRPPASGRFLAYAVPLGLLALAGLGVAAGAYLAENRTLPSWLDAALGIGSVLPVALAFHRPLLAWRLAFLMLFLGALRATTVESWPWNPVQILGYLVVLGRLAATEGSWVTAWATALSVVGVFTYVEDANAWGAAVLLVAVAAIGDIVSRRRQTRRLLAEQTELTELERAKRAVLEERARIAREMHDVVAHHMSMIAVQAETAPYRVPDLPEPAQDELATIATAARSALADMRRLLGVLRAETDEAMREPQPGPAELPALIETARRAGIAVTYAADGLDGVPGAVGLAAYRIVQEALANAARHAPGGAVDLSVRVRPDRLDLSVHNGPARNGAMPASGTGHGPPGTLSASATSHEPAGTLSASGTSHGPRGTLSAGGTSHGPPSTLSASGAGHGLVGMRERAELLGGTLVAGPDEGGGYRVEATLPFPAEGRPA